MTQRRQILTYALFLLLLGWSNQAIAQNEDSLRLPLQKGHTFDILEVKWSPDDKLLLTYSAADGYLNVWQMPEAKLITSIEDTIVRRKGSDKRALRAFSWSHDSRLIATGNENGTAQVWEARTGKLLWTTQIADQFVTGVGFSGDSKYLAAIASPQAEDHKIVLLEAATGRLVKEVGTTKRRFRTYYHDAKLSFSSDNKQLIVGDTGGIVTRWDLAAGSLLSTTSLDFCAMPNSFAYSEDMSLAVARCGATTYVSDTMNGSTVKQTSTNNESSSSVVLSRDNKLMGIGETGSAKFLDLGTGAEIVLDHYLPITCGCDLSKDNAILAFQDYLNSETVKLIDLRTKQTIARLESHPGKIKTLTFNADGKMVASGSKDRIVRVWDSNTGSLLQALAGHADAIDVVAFTPDGKLLVSSADKVLKVWEVGTGKLIRTVEDSKKLSSIAFSPDGKSMVTTSEDVVDLWDVSTWTTLKAFKTDEPHRHGDREYCCGSTPLAARFDTLGQLIISGHEDGTIKLWNPKRTSASEPVRVLKTSEKNESFALSPNDKLLVVNHGDDEPPAIWDWSKRKPLRRLSKDANYITRMAFSPDSQIIATSDVGGQLALWSTSSGKLLREFNGGFSGSDAIAFSPDGTRLVTGGVNQNIIMWDVKSGARLWNILPVRELRLYQLTPAEIAEQNRAAALAEAKEKLAAQTTKRLEKKVFISFSHFGEASNPLEARFVETGAPNNSLIRRDEADATGIWLRLHNNSNLPISFLTFSSYLSASTKCGYNTSTNKFFNGLCDGSEIGIKFSVVDAYGRPVNYGFGLHMAAISMLPPNTSVLFSFPKAFLGDGRSIRFSYSFLNEDDRGKLAEYGQKRTLTFSQSQLSKARRNRK